jgi:flagellar biosynthesis protein FlhG
MLSVIDIPGGDDQASGLRRLLVRRTLRVLPLFGAVRAADQARIAAGLAVALARCGRRVVILDQSRGEVPAQFGLRVRYDLAHVLSGDRDWHQVLLEGPPDITVLPAARGLAGLAGQSGKGAIAGLLEPLYRLSAEPDLLLLNLVAAGDAAPLADARGDWLFVSPSGASGVMTAYREIKQLAQLRPQHLQVLVDGGADAADAHLAFGNLAATAQRFLGLDLNFYGNVEHRPGHRPALDESPGALRQIAACAEDWKLRAYAPAPTGGRKPTTVPAGSLVWS